MNDNLAILVIFIATGAVIMAFAFMVIPTLTVSDDLKVAITAGTSVSAGFAAGLAAYKVREWSIEREKEAYTS